jgi:signal transduction histidine kinase
VNREDCVHDFLVDNREDLIARCKEKVAHRPSRAATAVQLANGIPLFLDQLTRTLAAEGAGDGGESLRISGASGGARAALSEMGLTATAHGKQLLRLGFTVDQVVHDYGDLCQAITDLAVERDEPFSVDEFRTLNRCLDNAIANAVSEFSAQRDRRNALRQSAIETERLGALVHELRNHLHTAALAFKALETGTLPIGGTTGGVLKRSLAALSAMLMDAAAEVQATPGEQAQTETFSLAAFIADATSTASLHANAAGCAFLVPPVDPSLAVSGDRDLLLAALVNLLQNAFQYTRPHTEVTLSAYEAGERIFVDVRDGCGGLAPGIAAKLFTPFARGGSSKRGLGLGLSIARRSVEASGGTLSTRDIPGSGRVFTMSLRRVGPGGFR